MKKQWRVTQYENGRLLNTIVFRYKPVAIVWAWVFAGRGLNGSHYNTTVTEIS